MKKLFIIGALALILGSCGGGKNLSSISVPQDVLYSFNRTYPYATDVDWKLKDGLYQAKFDNIKENDMEASFSANGTLVRVNS